jgi:hypothetical protein
LRDGREIPSPSAPKRGELTVSVPHPTKLARIEAALSVLGRHIELSLA